MKPLPFITSATICVVLGQNLAVTKAFAELPPIIEEVLLDGGRQQRLLPINFDEYVDVDNEDTTILLELEDSKERAAAESNNNVEYEYYYVYEDIENDTYDEAINEKSNITERDADHFISHSPAGLPPHLSQNGFVPIIPNPHHVVPAVPVVHHPPPVVHAPVPPPLDGYGVPAAEPVRTAEVPKVYAPPPPPPPPVTTPQPVYHAPAPSPQPTYHAPSPSPTPSYVVVHDYHTPVHGYHPGHHHVQHHHGHPHHPISSGPRDYFPAPLIPGLLQDEGATTLLSLIKQVDLEEALEGDGPFTIFAPTNDAFSKLDPNLVSALTDDPNLLRSVLLYHVVGQKLSSKHIRNDLLLDTLLVDEKNGNASSQLRITRNFENSVVNVNGAQLITSLKDQNAKNGIVHFVDEVIYPIPSGSLYEILAEDRRFRVLSEAIEVANLTALLNSTDESLTIFAPTDDAFDQLPRAAVDELFDDPTALGNLLAKHVVTSTLLSPSLTFKELKTVGGSTVNLHTRRGRVFVEDAKLVDGDIIATNGVIQVIDKVLL